MKTQILALILAFCLEYSVYLCSATCVAQSSATSDTTIPSPSVPDAPKYSTSEQQTVNLTNGWNFFPVGYSSWNYPGFGPSSVSTADNSITFSLGKYNSDNSYAYRAWNGTLFPQSNVAPFFKLWNYYDHTQSWYQISFDFMQSPDNQLSSGGDCEVTIKFSIFDMSLLDTDTYPNTIGSSWEDGEFGNLHCNTTTWDCYKEAYDLVLHSDSIAEGLTYSTNWNNDDVWIKFPSQRATTWTRYSAKFHVDTYENMPACDECYIAIEVENNGWPKWNQNISWSISNLTLERLSSKVTWEEPIINFWSEIVDVPRMETLAEVNEVGWLRENCPHERTDITLYEWDNPATWSSGKVPDTTINITLPDNKAVIIRSCSLIANETNPYQRIIIPSSSILIFDDANITLHTREIYNYGQLYIGSETCRLYSYINIYLHGTKSDSSTDNDDTSKASKGIQTDDGSIDIHGKQYHPTWTKLAISVYEGDDRIYLQESVNWEVGQEIVLVTSVWEDYETNHQNERFTISAIGDSCWTTNNVIYLSDRASYSHYAGPEYQTEVLLLSRRIKVIGVESYDKFGGHIEVRNNNAEGRFSGIEAQNMGQENVMARYPFHFHLLNTANNSFIQDCSVHESNFRCFTIHGTNNSIVRRNVAFNVSGHCLYIEDGVEENNTIEYNAISYVHPIARAASGDCNGKTICSGCQDSWATSSSDWVFSSSELVLPADTAASPYYVSNAQNRIIGNIASGGWSGFTFINMYTPLGKYYGLDYGNNNPYHRPTLEFNGNTAHSSGFYWQDSGCGSCIYGGGQLYYNSTSSAYFYVTGRVSHDTTDSDGNDAWMNFTNTKTYLCQIGTVWWGNRVEIHNYESHDNYRSVFFIGENLLNNALVNAHSNNAIGDYSGSSDRQGFEFYDTWVKLILNSVTFRNFKTEEPILIFMTHSSQFVPQGIAAVNNIKYDNCEDLDYYIYYDNCGQPCKNSGRNTNASQQTQSARIMAMYDYDGSASLTYKPTIVGTDRTWWNVEGSCLYDNGKFLWYCPMNTTNHEIGFIEIDLPGLTDGTRDADAGRTYSTDYYYDSVAYVSQFGRNYSNGYSVFPGIAGYTNMGWYFKSIYGAPAYFIIGTEIQIPRKSFIVLALKYPSNTVFNVSLSLGWGTKVISLDKASSLSEILKTTEDLYDDFSKFVCPFYGDWSWNWCSLCNDTGGVGPKWYFDNDYLYIRVVNPIWYTNSYYEDEEWWERLGMKLWDINTGNYYMINASCTSCSSSYSGFFDITDELPSKWSAQEWTASKYYDSCVVDLLNYTCGDYSDNKCTTSVSDCQYYVNLYTNATRGANSIDYNDVYTATCFNGTIPVTEPEYNATSIFHKPVATDSDRTKSSAFSIQRWETRIFVSIIVACSLFINIIF